MQSREWRRFHLMMGVSCRCHESSTDCQNQLPLTSFSSSPTTSWSCIWDSPMSHTPPCFGFGITHVPPHVAANETEQGDIMVATPGYQGLGPPSLSPIGWIVAEHDGQKMAESDMLRGGACDYRLAVPLTDFSDPSTSRGRYFLDRQGKK